MASTTRTLRMGASILHARNFSPNLSMLSPVLEQARQCTTPHCNRPMRRSLSTAKGSSESNSVTDVLSSSQQIADHNDSTMAEHVSQTAADYLQAFHSTMCMDILPWSATIPLAAIAIRSLSLPLVYHHAIHSSRAAIASKETPRIHAFVRKVPGTMFQKYITFRRLRNLALRSAGTSAWSQFRWHIFIHLPLVVSASLGLRQVATRIPEVWQQSSIGWISDISVADPFAILPVATTALWLWNLDVPTAPSRKNDGSAESKSQTIERLLTNTGVFFARGLQGLCVVSLSVTTELPTGIVLFWATNAVMTTLQRTVLTNDRARRYLGLLTKEDIASSKGPPVLQSTGVAVEQVRKELSYIQNNVMSIFKNRRPNKQLCKDVNRMLQRERWNGRISVDLEAVLRADDRDGRKYVAVVRRGTA